MGCPCSKSELLSLAQLQSLLRQAGWPEDLIPKYSAVTYYESCGGCARAYNKSGEYSIGLLQINMNAHGTTYGTEQQLYDPLWNLTQAYKIYKKQGDRAWINSVRKYNQDLNGIATKARQIYNGGNNPTPVITGVTPNGNITTTNTVTTPAQNNIKGLSKDDTILLSIIGLTAIVLLR